jgi:hypothetical protein
MKTILAAAIAVAGFAAQAPISQAQVAYIPPNAAQPRFGGEFALSELGPVAGYWRSECIDWHVRATRRRTGPVASPEVDAQIKRFISGLIKEKPDYQDLSPAMAKAVRKHIGVYWQSINRMGYASVSKRVDTDQRGNDLYVVDQTGGDTHWNVSVDGTGHIDAAFMCRGQGL